MSEAHLLVDSGFRVEIRGNQVATLLGCKWRKQNVGATAKLFRGMRVNPKIMRVGYTRRPKILSQTGMEY